MIQSKTAFGRNLRRLRLDQHWTGAALARKVGISKNQLLNLEKGTSMPRMVTAQKLAVALGTNVKKLLEEQT